MLRQITFPKISGRVLDINMSRPPVSTDAQGRPFQPEYDGREARKWDKIITKILSKIEDYDSEVEELIGKARRIEIDEELDRDEKNLRIARINEEIGELDETKGQELVSVVLESDEFNFIDQHWWDLKIPQDRQSRRKYTRPICDMLEPYNETTNPHGWVEVRVDEGKVVPVVHEPSPINEFIRNGVPKPKSFQRSRR